MEFYEHQVPLELQPEIEFFTKDEEIYFFQSGDIHHWDELSIQTRLRIMKQLESDSMAKKGLDMLHIYDPEERLKKYVKCIYGALNDVPDVIGDKTNQEYHNCGHRPCPADGLICKYPFILNGKLTKNEVELIRELVDDQPFKVIANRRNRSKFTIDRQYHNLAKKVGCNGKLGIVVFAGSNGIL